MSMIKRFERKYLPKARKKTWYRMLKFVVFFCLIPGTLPIAFCVWIWKKILSVRFTRKDKPDIVLQNIVDGFANLIGNDPEVEKVAIERAKVCAACPFAEKFGLYSVVIDNRTKQIQGMKCSRCGCNLSGKVRTMHDICPENKW